MNNEEKKTFIKLLRKARKENKKLLSDTNGSNNLPYELALLSTIEACEYLISAYKSRSKARLMTDEELDKMLKEMEENAKCLGE